MLFRSNLVIVKAISIHADFSHEGALSLVFGHVAKDVTGVFMNGGEVHGGCGAVGQGGTHGPRVNWKEDIVLEQHTSWNMCL